MGEAELSAASRIGVSPAGRIEPPSAVPADRTAAETEPERRREARPAAGKVRTFEWARFLRRPFEPEVEAALEARARRNDRSRTFAFVGSERLYRELNAHGRVVLVREESASVSLAIQPTALVIETCVEDLLGCWRLQLCGLDGQMSPQIKKVIRAAAKLGITVVVICSASSQEMPLYRELLGSADVVVLEGDATWTDGPSPWRPNASVARVPLTFEPTVAAPVIAAYEPGFRIAAPNASAALIEGPSRSAIAALSAPNLLLFEMCLDLSETQVAGLLEFQGACYLPGCSYLEMLHCFQHSDAVLLLMDGPAGDNALRQLALDALGCGAVVIAVGDTARLGSIAELVSCASDASDLHALVSRLSDPHAREQTWLSSYRGICREHSFARVVRALDTRGQTAQPPPAARISIVTATKRPALWEHVLANFTSQSYPDKELVVVLHGVADADVEVPPELSNDVRVLHAPASVNLGFCLNEGIRHATGEFWFKVDDDDYYGPHYVEDLMNAFAFSGADVLGKPSKLIYLEGESATVERGSRESQKRRFLNGTDVRRLTGATLASRKEGAGLFSVRRRVGVDSEWIERMMASGQVLFSSDYLSFIVFRAADKRNHTWTLPDSWFLANGARQVGRGLAKHLA
jgi:hypothetical protein